MAKCKIEGCENNARSYGWCSKHYQRWVAHGDPLFSLKPKGLSRKGRTCKVENCNSPIDANDLCNKHRLRLYYHNTTDARRNENGAGHLHHTGYVYVKINGKRIAQHRLVVEKAMGKSLPPGAIIHHLNGDKSDNRPCNLVVCPSEAYHNLLHSRQKRLNYQGPA